MGNCFGNNGCWWIIILLLLCGCNDGGCGDGCGCGNNRSGFGGNNSCWWIIILILLCSCGNNNGCGCGANTWNNSCGTTNRSQSSSERLPFLSAVADIPYKVA